MTKTLRVRAAAGWVTKPADDLDTSRLTAEEVDDNFLALEALYQPPSTITGDTYLLPASVTEGWLLMDGAEYLGTDYPDLYALTTELGGAWIGVNGVATGNLSYISGAIEGATNYTRGLVSDETYLYTGSSTLRVLTKDSWTQVYELDVNYSIYGIAVDANYVYIAHSSTPYFTVVAKADWSVVAGTPTLDGTAVAITDDALYVYIANFGTNKLIVVDKSDWSIVPGMPAVPAADYHGIVNDANYVYMTHGEVPYLTVVRKSDWTIVPSDYSAYGYSYDVVVDAQYVYIGQDSSAWGLLVLDKATGQTVPGVAGIGGAATDIVVDDTYVHVGWQRATGNWGRYTAVRKSDWGEQIEIAITNGAQVAGMGVDTGRVILVLGGDPYFEVYNISDFTLVAGTPTLPGGAASAAVHGGFTYVGHSGGNLFTVFDNSNWTTVTGTPVLTQVPQDIAVDDTYVYVVYWNDPSFTVYNKSDWSVVSGTPTLTGWAYSVSVDADYVYLGHGNSPYYTTVVRKSDWSVVTMTDPIPYYMRSAYTDGTQVFFVHSTFPYVSVRDKPGFATPVTGRIPAVISDVPDCVEADGTYVYVGQGISPGVTVINPAGWSKVGTSFSLSSVGHIAAEGGYLYIGRLTTDSLKVVEKATWTLVNTTAESFGTTEKVHSDGKYVYWSNRTSPYLFVYAIENENFKVPAVTSPITGVEYKVKT